MEGGRLTIDKVDRPLNGFLLNTQESIGPPQLQTQNNDKEKTSL
jgi:hypothetical protein